MMLRSSVNRPTLLALTCLALGSCGGDQNDSPPPPITVGDVANPPPPPPPPVPPPNDPPATNLLPPAPFGLTASTNFALVGWQQSSPNTDQPMVAVPAEQKGTLAWSADLKTYSMTLNDLASGRLVYTFPPSGNNLVAFSIIQADGTIARVYVTIILKTANVGELYWQSADGVTPFVYAHAMFGIPVSGSLPTVGRRVFTTDANPESSIVFDFTTGKVSGTVTSFNDGGSWDPSGPKEQATLEPADIRPDGSFIAAVTIPGAPRKGELRGRLFGAAGTELAIYWDAPSRDGYGEFGDWRAVTNYHACSSCTG